MAAAVKDPVNAKGYVVSLNDAPPLHLGAFLKHVADARSRDVRAVAHSVEVLKAWGSSWSQEVSKAAMGEGSGVTGGYLVPPALSFKLLRALAEKGFIYPRALKVEMTTRQVDCPTVNATSTATAGTSPFFGGMLFSWDPDTTAVTETEPTFGSTNLLAHNLIGYSKISNQMLADMSPEGEGFLVEIFARAAGWQAEYGFLNGTGTPNKMPLGVLNSGACMNVNRTTGSQVAVADIANMTAKLMPESWQGAIWACNPSVRAQLVKLGTWITNAGYPREGGAAGWLDNLPLYMTEKLPTLGSRGDLLLFDPSLYVIGTRSEVIIDASPHNLFQTNQTVFRVWLRVAGCPWMNGPVTLADGSTASSIVALN